MRKPKVAVLSTVLMLAVAIAVAGCGGSSESAKTAASSGSGSASSSASSSETAAASSASGEEAKGSGAAAQGLTPLEVAPQAANKAEVVKAIEAEPVPKESIEQIVAREEKAVPPQWEGPTEPVKPPAQKQKLALISCSSELHGCVTPLEGAQEAAKALGWTSTIYNGAGTSSTENKLILSAIAAKDTAILFTSINPALIQEGMVAAKKAKIPVISASSGSSSPDPTIKPPAGDAWPLLDVSQSFVETGRQMADWVINDSGGKANALVLTDKEYTSGISQSGTVDQFNKLCAECKLSTFNFTGTQVGTTLPEQTVGYLKTHPEVEYVVVPYDPAAATIVPAMAQAGITGVKVCSLLGDQQNLSFIRSGEIQTCDAAYDQRYDGWAMVDQLVRYLAHKPFFQPLGENVPQVLLDKNNLPPEGEDWHAPFNYRAEYKKLWGLG